MARRRETRSEREGGPVWAPPWWAPFAVFGALALAAGLGKLAGGL